ncbi:MAG: hypothetical protein GX285_03540 [Clostridiales bacterium]|nr:hypothetical protein [Clostridiales bacterium]
MLWFWVVRRELRAKKDTVNIAWIQPSACREKYILARNGPGEEEAFCILTRSHDIYHQSVPLYNLALHKPRNRIPGFLMGFRVFQKNNFLL